MLARPVTTALACRQCQSAVLRAVVSRPASSSLRTLPLRQTRQLPTLTKRFLSSQTKDGEPTRDKDSELAIEAELSVEESEAAAATTEPAQPHKPNAPWFLEVDPPRHPPSQHEVDLPKIPDDAPAVIEPMMKYIFEDMGLDDISLLDMRGLDPPAALGPNLIMLFGTTRSERHLHISSGRFVRWLRRNYKIDARADGLIGPGELRTKLRRLRKKAKLMGTNTAIIPGGDNGISTGWVCVNFTSNDGSTDEVESFDESGRFSGFGAPQTGTTVVIQCMTEARRNELNLEGLWQGVLKRSLQNSSKIRGEKVLEKSELDALVASKVQIPKTPEAPVDPSELQWKAMKEASQQRRYYSTSARRLSPLAEEFQQPEVPQPPAVDAAEDAPVVPDLAQTRKLVTDIQTVGIPITQQSLHDVIRHIFTSPSASETAAEERLVLVDQLLLTAEERGMDIWNNDMFVTLVESAVISPSYGPALQRAHKNLEFLMAQKGCRFDHDQTLRLMTAYASRHDWPRFWDAFRAPTRFRMGRDSRHYELAYRAMAECGDQKMCIEALRWVFPEMKTENPPVYLFGQLYDSLKACILVADPMAETLMLTGRLTEQSSLIQQRRMYNREFLKVIREVESMRSHYQAENARTHQAEIARKYGWRTPQ
ncbi:ATPase synthesis protein 25, mitochondrial [Dactylonectria macrodidyma]|uniref:ATPase synthesis protein 25 n=1 Tax=Dactylonectria macrodidyma TaxID=307937 RepID=A0A9P9ESG6_9HYPO|nr:ATPase synthesis protein 25, mitochondrial [Dactylonectria macrodidyma]